MKKFFNWMLVAILICGANLTLVSCKDSADNPVKSTTMYRVAFDFEVNKEMLKYFNVNYSYQFGKNEGRMKLYGTSVSMDLPVELPAAISLDVNITPKDGIEADQQVSVSMSAVTLRILAEKDGKITEVKKVKSPINMFFTEGAFQDVIDEVAAMSFSAEGTVAADGSVILTRKDNAVEDDQKAEIAYYTVNFGFATDQETLKNFNINYFYMDQNGEQKMSKTYAVVTNKSMTVQSLPAQLLFDLQIAPKDDVSTDADVHFLLKNVEFSVIGYDANDKEITSAKEVYSQGDYTFDGTMADAEKKLIDWRFEINGEIAEDGTITIDRNEKTKIMEVGYNIELSEATVTAIREAFDFTVNYYNENGEVIQRTPFKYSKGTQWGITFSIMEKNFPAKGGMTITLTPKADLSAIADGTTYDIDFTAENNAQLKNRNDEFIGNPFIQSKNFKIEGVDVKALANNDENIEVSLFFDIDADGTVK